MKLLHLKWFGELTKCLLITLGSIIFCNGGTAVLCNLPHGIYLVQEICPQRKPLRKKEAGQRPQNPLSRRYLVDCIWYVSSLLMSLLYLLPALTTSLRLQHLLTLTTLRKGSSSVLSAKLVLTWDAWKSFDTFLPHVSDMRKLILTHLVLPFLCLLMSPSVQNTVGFCTETC